MQSVSDKITKSDSTGATRVDVSKIPLSVLFGAVRRAPRGSRLRLFRRLFPFLSSPLPGSIAEVCKFKSLDNFGADYAQLATILGRAGKVPPPGEIEFLHSMLNRPGQYRGSIGPQDYFFLTAVVSILAPRRVVEIGTLTGFSAAIIAAAVSRQHGKKGPVRVDTIDVRPECMIDEARPTGFEIPELIPELASTIRLHIPHDSSFVRELAKRDELEVAFIDADHRHPRPLLDLLRLVPCVKSHGWIVLHDIRLGTMGRKAIDAGRILRWRAVFGAEWLFDYWPFRKISCGNIGAIQLPAEKSALIPFALRVMSAPFEIDRGKATIRARRALYQSLGALI